MSAESLKDLLVDEIQDLYHAEKQLLKALPKMADAAENEKLKRGIIEHLAQTEGHVNRLENVFQLLDLPAKGKTCPAMKGLIEEGSEAIAEADASAVRDARIIGSAQRVEHYEIAAYGTARSLAEVLGEREVVDLLQETLDEEAETDRKLTVLSSSINQEALRENEDEDERRDN
jgi:ferritin-like metal-binding protein YciE